MSTHRWPRRLLITALVLVVAAFAAFEVAVYLLKSRIEAVLGPRSEVQEIHVGLSGVEIIGLRLAAAANTSWPAPDLLRADRVVVTPSLADLFGARIVISNIRIEDAYVSMLRTPTQQLRVLPGLTERPTEKPGKAADQGTMPEIHIGSIELVGGIIEYYDTSVQRPPLKIRLEQIEARFDDIQLPDLKGQTRLHLAAVIKGAQRDGRIAIDGKAELASRDSDIRTQLRSVDLQTFRPYLLRASETGIHRGNFDLDLRATVRAKRLHAPGKLALNDLELASNGSFMGMSQSAAVALLKNRRGRIDIDFELDGNLDDPRFSLNEQMLTKVGTALAETLGVSIEGLARGGVGTGSNVMHGLGKAFGKLLGK
jgi:hypothetical protein